MRKSKLCGFSIGILCLAISGQKTTEANDYSGLIVERIAAMPTAGIYASYRRDLPSDQRFDELHATVEELGAGISVGPLGGLRVDPSKCQRHSFCSSATYLLFVDAIAKLQQSGVVPKNRALARELADVGDKYEVIAGKMDGVGIFGHWNANGPGTGVLFARLGLGRNFTDFTEAKPGDFLKIFWNENIGKGERGHLVVYLGSKQDGSAIQVWSSNQQNEDGSAGYGTMWIERSRIKRALFSRLEHPENLVNWLQFSEEEKTSDYLVRILSTGSSGEEMLAVTKAE
ncbi:MAG: hypothetical protein AAF236_15665 [Verrucomicrobiota bacterium]